MSKSKTKETQSYNTQTGVDPITHQRLGDIWDAANVAGMQGPSPLVTNAAGYNTGLQTAGNTGVQALSGNQAALQRLMNPYQSNVIDANNAQWQHVNQQTQNQVNDRAQAAGAFGGSRQGVATGTALAQNNLAQQGQTANLLSSGYNTAMNQAGTLAGLGAAGAGQNAQLGLQGVGNAQQWLMNLLKQGYSPLGSQSSGASVGNNSQSGFDLAKLAQAGAAVFGG